MTTKNYNDIVDLTAALMSFIAMVLSIGSIFTGSAVMLISGLLILFVGVPLVPGIVLLYDFIKSKKSEA